MAANGAAPGGPFVVKDCTLVAIATGRRAQTLRELRDHLQALDVESVYHHFWGRRLQPRFDNVEFNNDFAAWAQEGLQDPLLAERLGVVDPANYPDLAGLRQEVLEVVEQRLHEREFVPWSKPDRQFHFLRSQMVVMDTGRRLGRPEELPHVLEELSLGSVFYHILDARRRNPLGIDDFRAWLMGFGDRYEGLAQWLAGIDPYFLTLQQLREQWAAVCQSYFEGVAL